MARVTVEDCIDKVDSPYELVLVAKERTTQLNSGLEPTLEKDNGKLLFKRFLGSNAGRRGFTIDEINGEIIITASQKLFVLDTQTGDILNSIDTIPSVVSPIVTDDCYIIIGSRGDTQCHEKNLEKIKPYSKDILQTALF